MCKTKLYKLFSPTEIIFFFTVYQSIATHNFVNFARPHVCWCVSVDVAFYLKWGFGRQGRGFESGSWFLRDVGLSLQLWFWGVVCLSPYIFGGVVGLSPHLCFLGVGGFF